MLEKPISVAYYNGFWYSASSPIGGDYLQSITYKNRNFERIRFEIRLLTLLFDVIHIPRSHLLTFQNRNSYSVTQRYIFDSDFSCLTERSIILSSTLPHIDNHSDTERIVERVNNNNWSADLEKKFIETIKKTESIYIDSKRESKINVDIWRQYVASIKVKNKKLAKSIEKIVKKSTYKETPFLHELFVEELLNSNDIDNETKVKIWQDTNTIYMISGGHDLGENRRIPIDKRIEHVDAKHDNTGTLRELYSPEFIRDLIAEELGDRCLLTFKEIPIEALLRFRDSPHWAGFKNDIFNMFDVITQLEKIKPSEFQCASNSYRIMLYKKFILENDNGMLAATFAELLEVASGIYDPVLGKTVKTMKSIIAKLVVDKYADWKLSRNLASYSSFWSTLKEVLDENVIAPRTV